MEEIREILENYYSSGKEENRLVKDKAHQVEFLTTTKYIDKYLKKGHKILEVGAGTGRYSLHYAKKGYEVEAVELTKSNIEEFKKHITNNMKINIHEGNALDLSIYEDNTFDITLLLGPVYHLFTIEEKEKAINESIRVTKPHGKIFIAYITNDIVILSYGLRKGNLLKLKDVCDENYRVKEIPEEIFSVNYVEEFENMMKEFPVNMLHQVAVDGLSETLADYINELSEEEYKVWIDYHFKNCERKDLMGYSSHVLYICEKIIKKIESEEVAKMIKEKFNL